LLIRNDGNISAGGTYTVSLFESTDQTLDSSDVLLMTTAPKRLNLRSGKNVVVHLPFPAPANAAGYFLIATISATATTDTGTAVVGTR
jgi:hypothetical protein